jgi:hypothetical protein
MRSKLARASGVPIERLAGDAFKPDRVQTVKSARSSGADETDDE